MIELKESIVALATALACVRGADGSFARAYEALVEIEELIFRHKEAFGVQNALFQQGCEEYILLCNTAAIQHLPHAAASSDNGELPQCGDLLVRAEQHTRRTGYLRSVPDASHTTNRVQLRLLSLNNLACYYKQIGKPLAAIGFLEEALEIQLRQLAEHPLGDHATGTSATEDAQENAIALTHLNLSAVLSQMKRHDAAAEHARCATELLLQAETAGEPIDVNLLVAAFYNQAVEAEHLKDVSRVAAFIDKALAAARRHALDRDSSEVVGLLEDMRRSTRGVRSPHRSPTSTLRPPSPRTLRQRGSRAIETIMEERIVHAAAVAAVSIWTALALQAHAQSPQSTASSLTITRTTATSLAAEWIQEGLVHLQQHQQQREPQERQESQQSEHHCAEQRDAEASEETVWDDCSTCGQESDDVPPAESGVEQEQQEQYAARDISVTRPDADGADCSIHEQEADEPPPPIQSMALELIRSIAHSVASSAIQLALTQLLATRVVNGDDDASFRDPADLESMATERSASKDSPWRSPTTDTTSVTHPDVPVEAVSESLSVVASQFVRSLLDDAMRHCNTVIAMPTTAMAEEPSLSPPPSPSPVDSVSTLPSPSPPPPASDAPPPPGSSDLPTPSVILAAVQPPKQGNRRPQRKPIAPPTMPSPPRLAPVQRPPKTADHHHHHHHIHHPQDLLPVGGRMPRTSPRPVSHDHESFPQSPPRLRKLEEYLELHPVDRAKRVYRPRRPRHERHPTGSHTSVPVSPRGSTGGYDADQEGTHDDKEDTEGMVLAPPPPRVKLAPLRVAAVHPQLPLPTTSGESSHTTTIVDRPDRLGLHNKPKKRSGYCQQCGFEGRSCKVSDCLKHQPLR